LSATGEAFDWRCDRSGGTGHAGLRAIHADFNRLFGNPRLTAASGQCYYAVCRGDVFGFCNRAGVTRTEASDHRNWAVDTNPGGASGCGINFEAPAAGMYLYYIFTRLSDTTIGSNPKKGDDIRYC